MFCWYKFEEDSRLCYRGKMGLRLGELLSRCELEKALQLGQFRLDPVCRLTMLATDSQLEPINRKLHARARVPQNRKICL